MSNFFEKQLTELCNRIKVCKYQIVVVEGYDCVGKGRVIEELAKKSGAKVYRPDYNFWEAHALPKSLRWVLGVSLLDYFNNTLRPEECIIFDRGILSGSVYSDDWGILKGYTDIIQNLRVLHVLVSTDYDSYRKFAEIRGDSSDHFTQLVQYTREYEDRISEYKLDSFAFCNKYEVDYAESIRGTCQECGHYSHYKCKNPKHVKAVNPTDPRCENSRDKEVQDE